MPSRNFTAYDYEKQEWIEGEAARLLLIQQTRDELALLTGPKEAPGYWEFIGASKQFDKARYINQLRHILRSCGEVSNV